MRDEINPALYGIPIDVLGLSDNAKLLLARVGVETVGDCVDYFNRGIDVMCEAPFGFFDVMANEVRLKLIEHGYLNEGKSSDE